MLSTTVCLKQRPLRCMPQFPYQHETDYFTHTGTGTVMALDNHTHRLLTLRNSYLMGYVGCNVSPIDSR
jgi:hypothetical protein